MIKTSMIVATTIICTAAICILGYSAAVGGGTVLLLSQHDAFAPQPESITKDIQERAERVEDAVNNTISGREKAEDVTQAIQNEDIRSTMCSLSFTGDDYEIYKKYRVYLSEATDVVSATKGNQTELNNEIAQMNAAKQKLY